MTINTTNNKRVDPDDANADAVKEPAAKKRATDNNNIINVDDDDDDDDDDDVDESPVTAMTATTTTNIVPFIPLLDPTDPSYDLAANANKGPDMNNKVTWAIYCAAILNLRLVLTNVDQSLQGSVMNTLIVYNWVELDMQLFDVVRGDKL
jgi:hypothetical protein